MLFERLCTEPAYYLFRTERALLETAAHEIVDQTGKVSVIELGSGNAEKTRVLLDAYARRYPTITYAAIDINRSILERAAESMSIGVPTAEFVGIVGTYQSGLQALPPVEGRKLLICLGSTIGNMHDEEIGDLLSASQQALRPGDLFLVGIDMDKDSEVLEAAYNNQTAILTNLCVLQHVNWRFRGNFNVFNFRHIAYHNKALRRMESHLESLITQPIAIRDLGLEFELQAGETIRTEIMRKVILSEFEDLFAPFSFSLSARWIDPSTPYALCLFEMTGANHH